MEPITHQLSAGRMQKSSELESRLARYAYVSGILGAVSLLAVSYLLTQAGWIVRGKDMTWTTLGPLSLSASLVVLAVCGLVMASTELCLRWRIEGRASIVRHPHLAQGRYGLFFGECFLNFIMGWLALRFGIALYQLLGEYGYQNKAAYYQPFFHFLEAADQLFRYGALPYILVTRAFQYNPEADEKSFLRLLQHSGKAMREAWSKRTQPAFSSWLHWRPVDKFNVLGWLVKLFFIPLMTVFFTDQLHHVFANVRYLGEIAANGLPSSYALRNAARDFYNIGFSLLIMLDTGVAWCGYVISSRWLRNQTLTAEPTVLGWFVAASCYPPFNRTLGIYFPTPSESAFLSLEVDSLVVIMSALSIAGYAIYTAATLCFGLRFSNLTHRGIITTGPYRWVRHPAYATKNFAWWCLMFPQVVFVTWKQNHYLAAAQLIGLVGITTWYYLRALTEERHLGWDPVYVEYCSRVRYRFFPGLL